MPVIESKFRLSLGEGGTPLLHLNNSENHLGLKNLFLKDEGQNPTGTFKSRGFMIYPTGGGTGIVGMWKAFGELESIGLIGSDRPRMVFVQSSGCAPIVKAFQEGRKTASFWEKANWITSSSCSRGLSYP